MENNDKLLGGFVVENHTPAAESTPAPTQQQQAEAFTAAAVEFTAMEAATPVAPQPQPQPAPQPVAQPQPVAAVPAGVPTATPVVATATPAVGVDFAKLLADTEAANPEERTYAKIPAGTHYVKFNEFKIGASGAGETMVFVEFVLVGGDYDGLRLSESFFLGGKNPAWGIGTMKHRLLNDFGIKGIKWEEGLEAAATFINGAAAGLHLNVTISYKMTKAGKPSEYPTFDNVVLA